MSGLDAEVKVKLKAEGAEETKQRLLETRAAILGVSSEELKNAQAQRQAARDAQILNNAESYKTRIFLAQYPAINTATRALKDFGSIGRGVLAITTAFSTAITAFNSTQSGLGQLNAELEQAKREQAFALKTYGFDSKEYADATDKVNGLNSAKEEFNKQNDQNSVSNVLNFAGAIAVIGSSASVALTKIGPLVEPLAYIAGLGPALGIVAGIIAGFFIEPAITNPGKNPIEVQNERTIKALENMKNGIITIGSAIMNGFKTFAGFVSDIWASIGEALGNAWDAIKKGFVGFWNGFATIANTAMAGIVNGIVSFVNSIIAAVESALNALSRLTGGGGVSLGRVSIGVPQIPLIAAANGFDGMVNSPTMFLTGEAGPEHVTVTPSGRGGGAGSGGMVYNDFRGSTFTGELEFERRVDAALKKTLKRHGWT